MPVQMCYNSSWLQLHRFSTAAECQWSATTSPSIAGAHARLDLVNGVGTTVRSEVTTLVTRLESSHWGARVGLTMDPDLLLDLG